MTDAGLAHLAELDALISLNLGGTDVTGAGLVHLKNLKKLISLALYRTAVGDSGLAHLGELTGWRTSTCTSPMSQTWASVV